MKKIVFGIVFCTILILTGCSGQKEQSADQKRWYTKQMIQDGESLYLKHCASCHGQKGEGTILPWNEKMRDGRFPPPPLNDDAHAWHHPLKALHFTIAYGGKPTGGVMPGFKDKLSEKEIDAVIAHFQNFWTDPYYEAWLKRGGVGK